MPYAELDGLRVYYERAGRGEPELLFVHGWYCDHTAFQPQFEHFTRAFETDVRAALQDADTTPVSIRLVDSALIGRRRDTFGSQPQPREAV